jgi:hypothetical protein
VGSYGLDAFGPYEHGNEISGSIKGEEMVIIIIFWLCSEIHELTCSI